MSAHKDQGLRAQLNALCPVLDNLRLMAGAARHALNRHSLAELEELARLADLVIVDLEMAIEDVEELLEQPGNDQNPQLLRLKDLLAHLLFIAAHTRDMAGPIRKKIAENQIFPDNDLIHLNELFSRQTGMLRTLVDIFKTNDPFLKKYLAQECETLSAGCFQAESDHESRMTTSFGQPHAWGVYIALLELFRQIHARLRDIVKLLED